MQVCSYPGIITPVYLLTCLPELITGSKTPDAGVKNAMMKALQEVVGKAGGNMGEASKNAILGLIDQDSSDQKGKCIPMSGYLLNILTS